MPERVRRASSERRAIDWLVDESHVEPADAETERAGRAETVAIVLATVGSRRMVEVDDADIPVRWQDIGEAIDSGHTITVLRGGQPWAVISPHPPGQGG